MPHAVTSYRTAVDALLTLHDASAAEADAVLGFDRTVFVPSAPLTLAELTDSVKRAVDPAAHGALGEVSYAAADRNLTAAVGSFPTKVDCSRAMVRHVPQPRAPALSPRARTRSRTVWRCGGARERGRPFATPPVFKPARAVTEGCICT